MVLDVKGGAAELVAPTSINAGKHRHAVRGNIWENDCKNSCIKFICASAIRDIFGLSGCTGTSGG